MALPVYLKQQKEASVSATAETIQRKPDESSEAYDPMASAADDLIDAIKRGDSKGVAEALRAAYQMCSSEPTDDLSLPEET